MSFWQEVEMTIEHAMAAGLYPQARELLDRYEQMGQPMGFSQIGLKNRLRFEMNENRQSCRFLIFHSDNFVLEYIAKEFTRFLEKKGADLFHFPYCGDASSYAKAGADLLDFAREGIDGAFFFNHVGLCQSLQSGENLWEILEIPCYDYVVDHPMYYADSLDHPPKGTILICADRTHMEYARKYYPEIAQVGWMPTGGVDRKVKNGNGQRDIDLLFVGNYKYLDRYQNDDFAKEIENYLSLYPECPFDIAVERLMDETGKVREKEKQVIEKYRFLESNITAGYRKRFLESILTAGLNIEVYGNGWEASGLMEYEGFHLHPPIPFEESLKLMQRSKILLNQLAWFKEGSNERLLNGMAMGAVVVTDGSRYLDPLLKDGVNAICYRLQEIDGKEQSDKWVSEIKLLLTDSERREEIAENGKKLSQEHTWQKHLEARFREFL